MRVIRLSQCLLALSIAASAAASAAEQGQMPMQGMMGHHAGAGTAQQGMMGHAGAGMAQQGMTGCSMMSGGMGSGGMGAMMGGRGMPAFPPGNEKLQMQMHAEIMQKVGEIMAKYAERIPSR